MNEETKQEPRDINKLMDLPYSEMTEEEINLIVEWKSDIKARDKQFQALLDQQREIENEKLAIMQKEADENIAAQKRLADAAEERLKRASE